MPIVSKRLFQFVLAQRLYASDVPLMVDYEIVPKPGKIPNWEIQTNNHVLADIARSLQLDFELSDREFQK